MTTRAAIVIEGDPKESIARVARERDCSLIVVGTFGLFKRSLHLLFDGVPEGIDLRQVLAELAALLERANLVLAERFGITHPTLRTEDGACAARYCGMPESG